MALKDKVAVSKYLKILELEEGASEEEIKKSYKRLALKHHPDKNPDDPGATAKFQDLTKAYYTLTKWNRHKEKKVCFCPHHGYSWSDDEYDEDEFDWFDDEFEDDFYMDDEEEEESYLTYLARKLFLNVFSEFVFRRRFQSSKKPKTYRWTQEDEDEDHFFDFIWKKYREEHEEYELTEEDLRKFHSYDEWLKARDPKKRHNFRQRRAKKRANDRLPKEQKKSKKQQLTEQYRREQEMRKIGEELSQSSKNKQTMPANLKNKTGTGEYVDTADILKEIQEQEEKRKREEKLLEEKLQQMDALEKKKEKRKKRKERKGQKKLAKMDLQRNSDNSNDDDSDGGNVFLQRVKQMSETSRVNKENINNKISDKMNQKFPDYPMIEKDTKSSILHQYMGFNEPVVPQNTMSHDFDTKKKPMKYQKTMSQDTSVSHDQSRRGSDSLLQQHLDMYNEMMKVQPKRHTEHQLNMERAQQKELQLKRHQEELERLRGQKVEDYHSKSGGDERQYQSDFEDSSQYEKTRQEYLQRQRELERQRNAEEAQAEQDRKKNWQKKKGPPKWYEKDTGTILLGSGASSKTNYAARIPVHDTEVVADPPVNVWFERKKILDKKKEDISMIMPLTEDDEEEMLKKAILASMKSAEEEEERFRILRSMENQPISYNSDTVVPSEPPCPVVSSRSKVPYYQPARKPLVHVPGSTLKPISPSSCESIWDIDEPTQKNSRPSTSPPSHDPNSFATIVAGKEKEKEFSYSPPKDSNVPKVTSFTEEESFVDAVNGSRKKKEGFCYIPSPQTSPPIQNKSVPSFADVLTSPKKGACNMKVTSLILAKPQFTVEKPAVKSISSQDDINVQTQDCKPSVIRSLSEPSTAKSYSDQQTGNISQNNSMVSQNSGHYIPVENEKYFPCDHAHNGEPMVNQPFDQTATAIVSSLNKISHLRQNPLQNMGNGVHGQGQPHHGYDLPNTGPDVVQSYQPSEQLASNVSSDEQHLSKKNALKLGFRSPKAKVHLQESLFKIPSSQTDETWDTQVEEVVVQKKYVEEIGQGKLKLWTCNTKVQEGLHLPPPPSPEQLISPNSQKTVRFSDELDRKTPSIPPAVSSFEASRIKGLSKPNIISNSHTSECNKGMQEPGIQSGYIQQNMSLQNSHLDSSRAKLSQAATDTSCSNINSTSRFRAPGQMPSSENWEDELDDVTTPKLPLPSTESNGLQSKVIQRKYVNEKKDWTAENWGDDYIDVRPRSLLDSDYPEVNGRRHDGSNCITSQQQHDIQTQPERLTGAEEQQNIIGDTHRLPVLKDLTESSRSTERTLPTLRLPKVCFQNPSVNIETSLCSTSLEADASKYSESILARTLEKIKMSPEVNLSGDHFEKTRTQVSKDLLQDIAPQANITFSSSLLQSQKDSYEEIPLLNSSRFPELFAENLNMSASCQKENITQDLNSCSTVSTPSIEATEEKISQISVPAESNITGISTCSEHVTSEAMDINQNLPVESSPVATVSTDQTLPTMESGQSNSSVLSNDQPGQMPSGLPPHLIQAYMQYLANSAAENTTGDSPSVATNSVSGILPTLPTFPNLGMPFMPGFVPPIYAPMMPFGMNMNPFFPLVPPTYGMPVFQQQQQQQEGASLQHEQTATEQEQTSLQQQTGSVGETDQLPDMEGENSPNSVSQPDGKSSPTCDVNHNVVEPTMDVNVETNLHGSEICFVNEKSHSAAVSAKDTLIQCASAQMDEAFSCESKLNGNKNVDKQSQSDHMNTAQDNHPSQCFPWTSNSLNTSEDRWLENPSSKHTIQIAFKGTQEQVDKHDFSDQKHVKNPDAASPVDRVKYDSDLNETDRVSEKGEKDSCTDVDTINTVTGQKQTRVKQPPATAIRMVPMTKCIPPPVFNSSANQRENSLNQNKVLQNSVIGCDLLEDDDGWIETGTLNTAFPNTSVPAVVSKSSTKPVSFSSSRAKSYETADDDSSWLEVKRKEHPKPKPQSGCGIPRMSSHIKYEGTEKSRLVFSLRPDDSDWNEPEMPRPCRTSNIPPRLQRKREHNMAVRAMINKIRLDNEEKLQEQQKAASSTQRSY